MSRVELITAAGSPLLVRPFFADGDPGPIAASMAHVPELLDVAMPFLGAALGPSSVSLRAKEIVILRTSAVMSCRYCVGAHTPVAIDAGLGLSEVQALRAEIAVADAFTEPADLALIAWVDAVATGKGPVDDAVADAFRAQWPEHHVVEITVLIGATMLLNRYCSALELPLSGETLDRLRSDGFAT